MKLSNSIRQALLTLLNQNIIVASWGLSNICIKESYICFFVEGYKYKGSVVISEFSDGYKVIMNKHTLFCKLDSLVINLDEFIEKTTNYENRIDGLLDI